MRKNLVFPKLVEKKFRKKYIPIILMGKFIILMSSQILILRKPLLVKKKYLYKNYIFNETKDIIYKISSICNKDEIRMQLLAREYVKNVNINVKIPKIKWWSNYKNYMIIAMEKAPGKKIINKPNLYQRIVNIQNKLNKNNLYHNDFNKENILYDEINDDLWLIDFGEASQSQKRFTNLTKFLA